MAKAVHNTNSNDSKSLVPLVYEGEVINARAEMLSLTDMWKASGSDPSKRPVEWLRGEGTQRFVQFLAEDLGYGEVGKSHFGLVTVKKGGKDGGATYAFWQLGLAYAKYLSPKFHAWCNTVVRERMEGARSGGGLSAGLADEISRTFGIVRMLAHKVAEIEKSVPVMVEQALLSDPRRVLDNYVWQLSG